MTDLWRGLLATADPDDLAALAERLRPYLPPPAPANGDEWLDSKGAAAHLGISIPTLRRHTAANRIPVHQECDGGRVYFRRGELDEWRSRGCAETGDPEAR
jgi:excisionase family DNA binding protein